MSRPIIHLIGGPNDGEYRAVTELPLEWRVPMRSAARVSTRIDETDGPTHVAVYRLRWLRNEESPHEMDFMGYES